MVFHYSGGVVERVIDGSLLNAWADHVGGLVGIDMVGAVLRVILDDEGRRAIPDWTAADGLQCG